MLYYLRVDGVIYLAISDDLLIFASNEISERRRSALFNQLDLAKSVSQL